MKLIVKFHDFTMNLMIIFMILLSTYYELFDTFPPYYHPPFHDLSTYYELLDTFPPYIIPLFPFPPYFINMKLMVTIILDDSFHQLHIKYEVVGTSKMGFQCEKSNILLLLAVESNPQVNFSLKSRISVRGLCKTHFKIFMGLTHCDRK